MECNRKKEYAFIRRKENFRINNEVKTMILADKIIEKAKESDVPLYEDAKLASTLSKLEIGDMIPPELYGVVAQILVFVDNLDKLKGKMDGK